MHCLYKSILLIILPCFALVIMSSGVLAQDFGGIEAGFEGTVVNEDEQKSEEEALTIAQITAILEDYPDVTYDPQYSGRSLTTEDEVRWIAETLTLLPEWLESYHAHHETPDPRISPPGGFDDSHRTILTSSALPQNSNVFLTRHIVNGYRLYSCEQSLVPGFVTVFHDIYARLDRRDNQVLHRNHVAEVERNYTVDVYENWLSEEIWTSPSYGFKYLQLDAEYDVRFRIGPLDRWWRNASTIPCNVGYIR